MLQWQERALERIGKAQISVYIFSISEIILVKLLFVSTQSYWLFFFKAKDLFWRWLKMSRIILKTQFLIILSLYLNIAMNYSCKDLNFVVQMFFLWIFLKAKRKVTEQWVDEDWKQIYLLWNYRSWWLSTIIKNPDLHFIYL